MSRNAVRTWLLTLGLLMLPAAAIADSLETALMPGQVIAGHADLEADCKQCHVRFNKAAQTQLCLDCHKDVRSDVQAHAGHHGRISENECRVCHTEHKGRATNIAPVDPKTFDHRLTDFPLKGGHLAPKAECRQCHKPKAKWRDAPSDCHACHQKDDTHKGSLGKDCASCHVERNWKETRFDHAKTKFPLSGRHIDVACNKCHTDPGFKNAPSACIACHRKDDQQKGHRGKFGEKCETCHTDRDWKTIRFDHDRDTKYPLKGKHRFAKCASCHTGFLFKDKAPGTCIACHRDDDQKKGHKGRFGEKCASCHVEKDWKATTFDHDRSTRYPLRGKHASVKCAACHTGALYQEKLAGTCIACHAKDDKHRGQEGRKCESCHNERSWTQTRFDHGLSRFPLLGKHAAAKCKQCHLTPAFRDAKRECIACHRKDDAHKLRLGSQCESCHNARDWKQWNFDHDRRTQFRLDGKHKGLKCEACHTRPMDGKLRAASACVACHREEDVHDGRFGTLCERCHVTDSFKRIKAGAGRLLQ